MGVRLPPMSRNTRPIFHTVLFFAALTIGGLGGAAFKRYQESGANPFGQNSGSLTSFFEPDIQRVNISDPIAAKIVAAAHAQEGDAYNASYQRISYPNGDVKAGSGACTDVVIRSLRGAGYDLQELIHRDMARNFSLYPNFWGRTEPDTNIDHRRVPNNMKFFSRHGESLPLEVNRGTLKTWKPGDIVCWRLDGGRYHTGIVSDGLDETGIPLVIHNGLVCIEQDSLRSWPIIGHYRYPTRTGKLS